MGFIKDLGTIVGSIAGVAVGLPVRLAGEVVNSDFLREVSDGVFYASQRTGELVGNVAEGVTETVYGAVTEDSAMASQGFNKVLDSGATYVTGVVNGVGRMAVNGIETVDAILEGDTERAMKVGKEIAKTVVVGALAVTVSDVLDDVANFGQPTRLVENPNTHHVTPHYRTLSDGRTIWVDGDGNTSIDTFDGWEQSNPDYRV